MSCGKGVGFVRSRLPDAVRPVRAWRRVRSLLGDRTAPVLALAAASVGAGLAEAGVLALIAQVAASMVVGTEHLTGGLGPFGTNMTLGTALTVAFALATVRLILQLVVGWLPARISADVQARLRTELFEAYTKTSWPVQAAERDGHLQELMTNHLAQATFAVLNVAAMLSAGAMFLTLTLSAFLLSVPVAIVVLVSAAGLFALLRPMNRLGRIAARSLSQADVDHAAGIGEAVRLAEESHVFGTFAAQRALVGELIESSRAAFFRFHLSGRLSQGAYQSLMIMLIVGGLAGLYIADATDLASLGAAVLMLVRAGTYGQALQSAYHGMNQMVPYLDRLEGTIVGYRAAAECDGGRPLPAIKSLGFDHANFSYNDGRPVLNDVHFSIPAGEACGIVGPSGAGKSTIVQLLLRLRVPDDGDYLVNGEPAQSFSRVDWQRRVAYISQEPRVIQGTVADNIRFFRPIDEAAVERAARLAYVHDEIMRMPSGYDTVIGQRADAVSGGQRQRICLARALAGEPDVIVLDEPTSALDFASEAAVQQSLSDLHGRMTLIIISHRMSTLSICDRVLVLVDGAVEAFGPPAELSRTNVFFREAIATSVTS